jgi:hypothetical protein
LLLRLSLVGAVVGAVGLREGEAVGGEGIGVGITVGEGVGISVGEAVGISVLGTPRKEPIWFIIFSCQSWESCTRKG